MNCVRTNGTRVAGKWISASWKEGPAVIPCYDGISCVYLATNSSQDLSQCSLLWKSERKHNTCVHIGLCIQRRVKETREIDKFISLLLWNPQTQMIICIFITLIYARACLEWMSRLLNISSHREGNYAYIAVRQVSLLLGTNARCPEQLLVITKTVLKRLILPPSAKEK